MVARPKNRKKKTKKTSNNISVIIGQISTKLDRIIPWEIPYQNCSNCSFSLHKMAARAKSRKKNNFKQFLRMVQSRQPVTYRLMESVGLVGPRWHGSSWLRGITENGSSQLSTLKIDTPGILVWHLPCVQQASYLEGGPMMWMLPLYLHVKKFGDDDDDDVYTKHNL